MDRGVGRARAGANANWPNTLAAAVLCVVAIPVGLVGLHLGQAFVHLWYRLIYQAAGNIPPGTAPGSDEALLVLVFTVDVLALCWAHASVERGLRRRTVPVAGLLCVWAVVCFSDGINTGFAAIIAGMFGLVILCDLALSIGGGGGEPDSPFVEAVDGLCDPRLPRCRR